MSDMVNNWGYPPNLNLVEKSLDNLNISCQILSTSNNNIYNVIYYKGDVNSQKNQLFSHADSTFIFKESSNEINYIVDEINNVNSGENDSADYFDAFAIDYIGEIDYNGNYYIKKPPLPIAFGGWGEYNITAVTNNDYLYIFLVTYNETEPFWNVGLSIVLVLAFIFLLSFFTRKYLKPVRLMKNRIVDLEHGDLKSTIAIISNDELSELSKYMNKLIKNIKVLLDQKQALLSDVSHELRSPLARMKLLIEMIPDHKNIYHLKYEIDFLEELISNLLLSDKLSTPYAQLDLEVCNAKEIVDELKIIFKNNIKIIDFNLLSDSIEIEVDKTKLLVAVKNIISNSIKYNRNNNKISINIATTRNLITFTIIDKGIGFDEENIKNILEPFYRIDVHSEQTGFGLGLTICNKIISAHNGTIDISSTKNEGSKFILSIPRKQK
tara:strand:+ start:1104 stop:2417 length:1314 start_codon:yes stop_codon:yes gene_type:complete